jgi:hypothetical protein
MKIISFFFYPFNGVAVEWNWQGKTEVLEEKPAPVPLCPPQITHGLTGDQTRASAVRGRRLTAWAIARPSYGIDKKPASTYVNMNLGVIIRNLFIYWD